MPVLEIRGIQRSFGDKQVLRGVDLTVDEGSVFGFIGKNGAGKTTLIKLVLGLMEPQAGEISVCGEAVRYGASATNRFIGYLPDVPEFDPFLSAREYLHFCGALHGMTRAQCEERAEEMLTLVGLREEKHRIKGFSRGMKQRLGIAQALFHSPKLLICDEPTSALDPIGRKEILDILSSVRAHTTVLFSTHILSDVERICTDAAFLSEGKIALRGKVSELKAARRAEDYRLTLPIDTIPTLLQAFPTMTALGDGVCSIPADPAQIADLLGYLSEHRILPERMERTEPTLESLFVEVSKT